jgi:hypothetical protein
MTLKPSNNILQAKTEPPGSALNSQKINELEILISSQLKSGSPGPRILSKFLSENGVGAAKYIIDNRYNTVAQGEFEWLLDLKEAGYSNDAILDSLLESAQSGPWATSNCDESRRFDENGSLSIDLSDEHVLPNFHQPRCVHRGPEYGGSLSVSNGTGQSSECQPSLSFDKIESIRTEVAELCGVAGVYPPCYGAGGDHKASFEETCVRIEYQCPPKAALFLSRKMKRYLGN